MRRVLRELKPTEFEDIISVLALYRPGPMEFIPKYIKASTARIQVEYPHPSLGADPGGYVRHYRLSGADHADRFADGRLYAWRSGFAATRGIKEEARSAGSGARAFRQWLRAAGHTADDANAVYDMIVRFADYGFPRAHATAYGVLAFQTAYLKAHYPMAFMASMLTAVMGNHRKMAEYVDECRRMGIDVLPPDVNESGILSRRCRGRRASALASPRSKMSAPRRWSRSSPSGKRDRMRICSIFVARVDLQVCNKRVLESLILGGAFDSLPGHRAQLLAMLDETMEAAQKWKKERDDLQLHLFGFTEEVQWTVELPDVRPFPEAAAAGIGA